MRKHIARIDASSIGKSAASSIARSAVSSIAMLFALLLISPAALQAQSDTGYTRSIDAWHTQRIKNLSAENGWLNLVGLYWLEPGKNTFGSDKDNKIVFPAGTITGKAGAFVRTGDQITLIPDDRSGILINGRPIQSETLIYSKDSSRHTPVISAGTLRWTIIQRDDKIGVRLRDLKSPQLTTFHGIDRFPVDPAWRIPATLETQSQRIAITNVLGQTSQQASPGKLVFSIDNHSYSLDALDEGGDELFIIFGDETSAVTTYPSGRFLQVKKPGPDGKTTIDFNKAYNPPCAFTSYATCPLPPKQNILPVPITAGEKNAGNH